METGDKATFWGVNGHRVVGVITDKVKLFPNSPDHSTGARYTFQVTATKDPIYKRGETIVTLGTNLTKR